MEKKNLKESVEEVMYNSIPDNNRGMVMYTGYGGHRTFDFSLKLNVVGRTPMPRKQKKRFWGNKKDRQKYCPEYYKTKPISKREGKIIRSQLRLVFAIANYYEKSTNTYPLEFLTNLKKDVSNGDNIYKWEIKNKKPNE